MRISQTCPCFSGALFAYLLNQLGHSALESQQKYVPRVNVDQLGAKKCVLFFKEESNN